MPLDRRLFLTGSLGAAALGLAGCASTPRSPTGERPPIDLVGAFRGRNIGQGVFRVPVAGIERPFRAVLVGTVSGDRLTVVEDFAFADGETDRLTWRFVRSGPGRWRGTREDVVGEAEVIETGGEIRLAYTADARSRGTTTRLGFADVIYRAPDGSVINDAVVSRFGVPVGTVRFEIRRIG